jgi:3D (Asp-Asp-Asp) domain-containing protein/peptidoglycan hydrolase CwlO-like protein
VRAATSSRRARTALLLPFLATALLAAAAAKAGDPPAAPAPASAGSAASRQQTALLELYALESRLRQAQGRLSSLEARRDDLARRQATARKLLTAVRGAHGEAQRRLGNRLRALYVQGEVDPLAVLLGAASFDDAVTQLDDLERAAREDRRIVQQARAARHRLAATLDRLARRDAELRGLTTRARAARDELAAAATERRATIARLERERRLGRARVSGLVAEASAAAARSETLAPEPPAQPAADGGSAGSGGSPAPAPPAIVGGAQVTVVATAYALAGSTASGLPVGPGVVAVDPGFIPLGTRLLIPGYGVAVAADTGGAIVGNRIDVWVPTEDEAQAFGWQTLVVTVL